ncbi:MAG: DUF4252 domain-containing protein [Saprospiraceae bacterium]|nr:DUF4252 domain-containing protein [Saprospiraceae bacterium]
MKTILFSLVSFFLFSGLAHAQQESLHRFVDKYKQNKAFTYSYMSKDLVEVVAQTEVAEKDWQKLQNVVKNIGSLSILVADSIPNARAVYHEALAAVPVTVFDELLTVRDGADNVRIWAKTDASTVTDLVLLVGSAEEFVLICFTGNLELGNLSELGAMLDAEQAQHLAQTTQAVAIDFQVSPNPSSGEFSITCSDAKDIPQQLTITDQNGRQVVAMQLTGETSQRLSFPDLKSGLYWVQVKTVNGNVGVKQVQIVR